MQTCSKTAADVHKFCTKSPLEDDEREGEKDKRVVEWERKEKGRRRPESWVMREPCEQGEEGELERWERSAGQGRAERQPREMASSWSNRCTRTSAWLHPNSRAQTHMERHIYTHRQNTHTHTQINSMNLFNFHFEFAKFLNKMNRPCSLLSLYPHLSLSPSTYLSLPTLSSLHSTLFSTPYHPHSVAFDFKDLS